MRKTLWYNIDLNLQNQSINDFLVILISILLNWKQSNETTIFLVSIWGRDCLIQTDTFDSWCGNGWMDRVLAWRIVTVQRLPEPA